MGGTEQNFRIYNPVHSVRDAPEGVGQLILIVVGHMLGAVPGSACGVTVSTLFSRSGRWKLW